MLSGCFTRNRWPLHLCGDIFLAVQCAMSSDLIETSRQSLCYTIVTSSHVYTTEASVPGLCLAASFYLTKLSLPFWGVSLQREEGVWPLCHSMLPPPFPAVSKRSRAFLSSHSWLPITRSLFVEARVTVGCGGGPGSDPWTLFFTGWLCLD